MELAVPSFVFTAPGSCLPRTTDCFGPVDSWIQANPVAAHQPPGYTRRANPILIAGTSSSIRKRSRFPLHPSLPAMSGVFIEVLDERSVISFCIFPGGSGLRKVLRRRPPGIPAQGPEQGAYRLSHGGAV